MEWNNDHGMIDSTLGSRETESPHCSQRDLTVLDLLCGLKLGIAAVPINIEESDRTEAYIPSMRTPQPPAAVGGIRSP